MSAGGCSKTPSSRSQKSLGSLRYSLNKKSNSSVSNHACENTYSVAVRTKQLFMTSRKECSAWSVALTVMKGSSNIQRQEKGAAASTASGAARSCFRGSCKPASGVSLI